MSEVMQPVVARVRGCEPRSTTLCCSLCIMREHIGLEAIRKTRTVADEFVASFKNYQRRQSARRDRVSKNPTPESWRSCIFVLSRGGFAFQAGWMAAKLHPSESMRQITLV
ncbi:Os12g0530476 [Oryza sativa Japonica Group]|uniref:Os12g0530476 protein n=1 Tax=Oryza sativa subsp. japonica TaxID=39947 RepID=A0A0P0YB13_ORYSJ|nr:Os12g0530476 [Oryza sativa Japonica Group]